MNKLYRAIKYIKVIILLVIFGFIFKRIAAGWDKITAYPLRIDYGALFLSCVGLCFIYVASGLLWRQILKSFQDRLTPLEGLRIWLYSQLAKYLPGRGFIYLGRAFLCQEYAITNRNSLISSVVEFGIVLLSSFIFILISQPFIPNLPIFISRWWIAIFVFLSLIAMHPKFFIFIINKIFSLFKREKMELHMTYMRMIGYLFMYILLHVMAGLSFFFFVRAFYFVSFKGFLFIAVSFIVSYISGILSFLTPAGLGVREGILLILLNNVLPFPIAAQIAIFSRFWTIFTDLFCAGTAFVLHKISRR